MCLIFRAKHVSRTQQSGPAEADFEWQCQGWEFAHCWVVHDCGVQVSMVVYQDIDPLAGEVANDIQEPSVDTVIGDVIIADATPAIGVGGRHLHGGQYQSSNA